MKVFGLMGLIATALLMVSAEEKMPDGFQQWTGASLKDLEQTLKTEADASSHHMSVRRLADQRPPTVEDREGVFVICRR